MFIHRTIPHHTTHHTMQHTAPHISHRTPPYTALYRTHHTPHYTPHRITPRRTIPHRTTPPEPHRTISHHTTHGTIPHHTTHRTLYNKRCNPSHSFPNPKVYIVLLRSVSDTSTDTYVSSFNISY